MPFPASALKSLFLVGLLCIGAAFGRSTTVSESPRLAAAFARAGVTGTFVMLDPGKNALVMHDQKRAHTRYFPASTFKIANTIIGLECGAVSSVDEVLPYGGKSQPFPAWEHDMSLRDAIKISNVPVYQELARRIGLSRMQAGVEKLDYGNRDIGKVVDRFWLDGPLQISAVEQVEFLRRVAAGDLPVAPGAVKAVQEITLQEKTETAELHGKTGWSMSLTLNVGWYVGWVQRGGVIYPFALNIDTPDNDTAAKRVPLAKECLRLLGAL